MHTLTNRGGAVLATRQATQSLPLDVAPLLSLAQLETVEKVTATNFNDERPQDKFTRGYTVDGFELHNDTYLKFHTTVGDEIVISRAHAQIVKPDGTVHSTCAANAGCASFEASGLDITALKQELRERWAANPLPEIDPETYAKSAPTLPRARHCRQANSTNTTAGAVTASNASSLGRRSLKASNSGGIAKRELDGGKWMNHVDTTAEVEYFKVNKYHEREGGDAAGMQHPEWEHTVGQPCSKRRARRRLAWEPRKPGLDWSWMRSEPADPVERARERRRLHTDFDAAWAAWNASDLSEEFEDLTLQAEKCLSTTNLRQVCEEYAEYLKKILNLSKLHCLVCTNDSGGKPRRLSSLGRELSSSGPTWCVHTLADLYLDTKDIEGEFILDKLANAAFAGEADPQGIPGAIATPEQAYSFYTRMYLDQGEPTPTCLHTSRLTSLATSDYAI